MAKKEQGLLSISESGSSCLGQSKRRGYGALKWKRKNYFQVVFPNVSAVNTRFPEKRWIAAATKKSAGLY